jgi:hypothetical protein
MTLPTYRLNTWNRLNPPSIFVENFKGGMCNGKINQQKGKVRIICLMAEIKALEELMNDDQEEVKYIGPNYIK